MRDGALAGMALIAVGCRCPESKPMSPAIDGVAAVTGELVGSVEMFEPRLADHIDPSARFEKLATGFRWSEGPVWDRRSSSIWFSDVPRNMVFCWSERGGLSVHMRPSGFRAATEYSEEPGSNGLQIDREGRLVLCEHGDRRVGRIEPDGRHVTLADRFDGKRFHSPNDLVVRRDGSIYFTDPPYGLPGKLTDPLCELPFCGVYLLRVDLAGVAEVVLLASHLTFPNGIALSPDERILYVAISDPNAMRIVAFDVAPDGTTSGERVFFDAMPLRGSGNKGSTDGLKIARDGTLFATGPGGVLVIEKDGTLLGRLRTGEATANCAWGDDGSTLYVTADMHLLRIQTRTKGAGF
jgi:gluconolactonase